MTPRERALTDALEEARKWLGNRPVTDQERASLARIKERIRAALATPAPTNTVTLRMVWRELSKSAWELLVDDHTVGFVDQISDGWRAMVPLRKTAPTLSAAKSALEAAVRAMEDGV